MAPSNFDLKMLETLITLLPKLRASDAAALYPLIEQELKSPLLKLPSALLQDQLSVLAALASLAKELHLHHCYFQELNLLIKLYLAEACKTLSQPIQGTLQQQISILQQVLHLRQQIGFLPREGCLDNYIHHRLEGVESLLTVTRSCDIGEQVEILNALVDLDTTLKGGHWSIDCFQDHIKTRLGGLQPDNMVKKEESSASPGLRIGPSAPGDTTVQDQPHSSLLQSVFAERAQRLENQQREQRFVEATEARARARARREAVAADPAKAEQRKYAEEQKVVIQQDKIERGNILANIADDRAKMKDRAEQERLARGTA